MLIITLALVLVAGLYSSVGHGGASGYLAIFALAGLAPAELRPAALTLNVLVSSIALAQFAGRGHFDQRLLWPFVITSMPAAFAAGLLLDLRPAVYGWLLAAVLVYAAWRLWKPVRPGAAERPINIPAALVAGLAIGGISGTIGVGGGIFLSPLILLMGWASPRRTAAVSAAFILINSLAALVGLTLQVGDWPIAPQRIVPWLAAVAVGAGIGAWIGSARLDPVMLRRLLGLVLIIAAVKMVL